MSKIDELLNRVQGPAEPTQKRAPRLDPAEESFLHHYPRETSGHALPFSPAPALRRVATTALHVATPRGLAAVPQHLERKLIVSPQALPLAIEQYRRLAGSLHELQVDQGLKSLMVTSAVPHEGKTLTVANLALTLSESYRRRVLLIDADLRRPFIHQLFRLPDDSGLGDVLRGQVQEVPYQQVTEHLTVLPAGHSDQPMEGLTSEAMRSLLQGAAEQFDWVLLDAAPVGVIPDARLLAALTRAVLFVIAARSTPHVLVTKALAEIDPEFIVGTVLNRVEEGDLPGTAYYNDYYSTAQRL